MNPRPAKPGDVLAEDKHESTEESLKAHFSGEPMPFAGGIRIGGSGGAMNPSELCTGGGGGAASPINTASVSGKGGARTVGDALKMLPVQAAITKAKETKETYGIKTREVEDVVRLVRGVADQDGLTSVAHKDGDCVIVEAYKRGSYVGMWEWRIRIAPFKAEFLLLVRKEDHMR